MPDEVGQERLMMIDILFLAADRPMLRGVLDPNS